MRRDLRGVRELGTGVAIAGSVVASLLLLDGASFYHELGLLGAGLLLSVTTGNESPWTVATAGLAVFVHALISPMSLPVGSMLLFGLLLVPRSFRARTPVMACSIVALGAFGGGVSGFLVPLYSGTPMSPVAVGVSAMLVLGALIPPVDDRIAARLRSLAVQSRGKTRRLLLRAYAVRRRFQTGVSPTHRTRRVEHAWRELVLNATERIDDDRASHPLLDARLETYVRALLNASRSTELHGALSTDLQDLVRVELQLEQETLDAGVLALKEIQEVV